MKSIKIKPGETFELIITDEEGTEIVKQCYYFDPTTAISIQRVNGYLIKMELMPAIDMSKLVDSEEFVSKKGPFEFKELY